MVLMLFFLLSGELQKQTHVFEIHAETTSVISGKTLASRSWLYLNDGTRIEKRALKGDMVMIWRRDAKGEMTMTALHKGHLIEYAPSDLRAIEYQPTWADLGQPVPGKDLIARLEKKGELTINGRELIRYEGVIGEARFQIHWSEALNIPVFWQREAVGRKEVIRISKTFKPGKIKPFKDKGLPRMDFADVGDNEWLDYHGPGHEHGHAH